MARIVVIGSLNMDLVARAQRLPQAGETLQGTQYLTIAGGKGGNQACAAARLGGDVAMLGRVGDDEPGTVLRAGLAAAGCDVSGVQSIDGASGVAMICVAPSGENSIVVIPGANHRYLATDLRIDEHRLTGAQFVLLQLETPLETVEAAAQAALRCGARVILDPAPASASLPQELLRCVHILTPNESEANQLVGRRPGPLSMDEARTIAAQLQAAGAQVVIIKLGAQGCLLVEPRNVTSVAAPTVDAVDTTAAGDVFNGALAVALSEGATLAQACRFAVQAAALSVTRNGAQSSMPRRAELISWDHRT